MATDALRAGLSGGRSMERTVPFRVFEMTGQAVMALRTNTRAVADGDIVGISDYAIRNRMLTAGAVTVLALDVGHVLQGCRHGGPVAVGQHCRESPAVLRRDVVKPAVDGERVGIIAERMALNAILAVVAADQAIDGRVEHAGMGCICVCGENAGRTQDAAAMAGRTQLNTIISGRCDGDGNVRRDRADGVRAVDTCRGDRG